MNVQLLWPMVSNKKEKKKTKLHTKNSIFSPSVDENVMIFPFVRDVFDCDAKKMRISNI